VIAVDTNILVYAHREDAPFHAAAVRCLTGLAEGGAQWAIPWPCLHEFIAIVTHPRVFDPPSPLSIAVHQVEAWLESPTLALLAESEQHWTDLKSILDATQVTGARLNDARIAALCRQHAVRQLWSADRDFSRFSDLSVVNPLTRTA
jgi:toxin-antitoxin system PIN domain toxin